ncbi:MAG: thioredoxin domain-containing protein, partial [Myxococcota bacterium]
MNHADLSSSGSSPVGSPVLAASGRAALIAALFGLAVSAACAAPPPPVQQPNPLLEAEAAAAQAETRAALDDLDQRIEQLDKRMETLETLLRQALGPSSPDSDTVYSVPIAGLPYVGPEHAKVTIVKAYEFACHYCLRVVPTLRKLQADYAGDIKIVYAPYIVHPEQAVVPALAACAADKQGKFSEMEAMIWTRGFAERDLSEAKMNDLADQLGLDMGRYRNDVHGEPCMES